MILRRRNSQLTFDIILLQKMPEYTKLRVPPMKHKTLKKFSGTVPFLQRKILAIVVWQNYYQCGLHTQPYSQGADKH